MARNLDEMVLKTAVARGLIDRETAKVVYRDCQHAKRSAIDLLMERSLVPETVRDDLLREAQRHLEPKVIAGFRIDAKLGQGGMGAVYRATQLSIDRQVALKVLSPQVAKAPGFRDRFLREARAMGAINHPNVVTCHDAGEDSGILYMALELMTGGDADGLMARHGGRLAPRRACQVVRDAAGGLAAIHRAGLIHRDIKPANIFLAADGSAKLADLGLARLEDGDDRMTRTGAAVGTPAFMSPEQAKGADDVDIRSDIYALGATLFNLVTGEPPYSGASVYAVVAQVINNPPPDPRTIIPDLPAHLCDLILRCLAKDRTKRPQTPQDLIAALSALHERLPFDNATSQRRQAVIPPHLRSTPATLAGTPRRWPWIVAGVLAVVGVGIAGVVVGINLRDRPAASAVPTAPPRESAPVVLPLPTTMAALRTPATAPAVKAVAPISPPAVTPSRPPARQPAGVGPAAEPVLTVGGLRWRGDPGWRGRTPSIGEISGTVVDALYGPALHLDGHPATITAPVKAPLSRWTLAVATNITQAKDSGGLLGLVSADDRRYVGISHLAVGGFSILGNGCTTPSRVLGGDGNWHFLVLSDDGARRSLYVNGMQVTTEPGGFTLDGNGRVIAGAPWTGSSDRQFIEGLLDIPMLFDRALEAADVKILTQWALEHAGWMRDRRTQPWNSVRVANHGFEHNQVGGSPAAWQTGGDGVAVTEDGSGGHCLRLESPAGNGGGRWARQIIPVDLDWIQVRLRARVRLVRPLTIVPNSGPPHAGLRVTFQVDGNTPVVRNLSGRLHQAEPGSWFELRTTDGWPVPAGAQSMTVEVGLTGVSGAFEVDDVRMESTNRQ